MKSFPLRPFLRFIRVLPLWICLFAGKGQAQSIYYVQVGYNQSFASLDSLNFVIDNFNDRITWPEAPMKNIHAPNGITAGAGIGFGRVLLDLAFVGKSQTVRAEGATDPNSGFQQREVIRFRMNTFDIGPGIEIVQADAHSFAIGTSLSMGGLKLLRKSGAGSFSSNTFNPVYSEIYLGNSIWAQYIFKPRDGIGPAVRFRPYFNFAWTYNDYFDFNRMLNFQTYFDDPESLRSYAHHFGFILSVGLAGRSK